MSDSHGSLESVEKIISANPNADMFIHLGDGEREVAAVRAKYPDLNLISVCGNCNVTLMSMPEKRGAAAVVLSDGTQGLGVCGNCDWNGESPAYTVAECGVSAERGEVRIFCTHGHRYYVKSGTETLRSVAKDNGCCAIFSPFRAFESLL